jgi:hypothetical protein
MRFLLIIICITMLSALSACGSPPQEIERKSAYEPPETAERMAVIDAPDYTKDWRTIADLGSRINYGPEYPHIRQLLWKRRNWRMTLSGEWIDDMVEDFQRRYRWDTELTNWVAEHGNPEWPR